MLPVAPMPLCSHCNNSLNTMMLQLDRFDWIWSWIRFWFHFDSQEASTSVAAAASAASAAADSSMAGSTLSIRIESVCYAQFIDCCSTTRRVGSWHIDEIDGLFPQRFLFFCLTFEINLQSAWRWYTSCWFAANDARSSINSLAPIISQKLYFISIQALRADDKSLLESVLSVNDERIIRNTVRNIHTVVRRWFIVWFFGICAF